MCEDGKWETKNRSEEQNRFVIRERSQSMYLSVLNVFSSSSSSPPPSSPSSLRSRLVRLRCILPFSKILYRCFYCCWVWVWVCVNVNVCKYFLTNCGHRARSTLSQHVQRMCFDARTFFSLSLSLFCCNKKFANENYGRWLVTLPINKKKCGWRWIYFANSLRSLAASAAVVVFLFFIIVINDDHHFASLVLFFMNINFVYALTHTEYIVCMCRSVHIWFALWNVCFIFRFVHLKKKKL